MKATDLKAGEVIAAFFAEKGVRHVFTVSGAGNIRILDAIHRTGSAQIVCTHHEQAAAQAAIGYFRASGRVAPVVVTMGGGAANVVTGIVSAWMDSIPLVVVAGTENRYYTERLRAHGVQSFDLWSMVAGVTKYAGTRIDHAWAEALHGRPGPVLMEVALNAQ
jgi:acetolactate synthase-1/2/3 large subunit